MDMRKLLLVLLVFSFSASAQTPMSKLLRKQATPAASWVDLAYPTVYNISESPTHVWNATSTGGWANYAISATTLPANGGYASQYANTSAVSGIIGFNTSNTNEDYTGYETWFQVASGGLIYWGENSSFGSTGVYASVGDWVRMHRVGSTIKIQTSSDKISWTDIYTYSFTSSATLYLNLSVYDNGVTVGQLYYPQILIE